MYQRDGRVREGQARLRRRVERQLVLLVQLVCAIDLAHHNQVGDRGLVQADGRVVIRALLEKVPELKIYAWGGPKMAEAGATVIEETARDGAMGVGSHWASSGALT